MRRSATGRSAPRPLIRKTALFPAISASSALIIAVSALLSPGCGKKGPPLPPLVKLPAAPADVTAARRGDTVIVELRVPNANTDNTRPANVSRVDVYGFTGSTAVSEDQVVKLGAKVGSVAVKSPRDPDQTLEPDESESDIEPLVGHGLDQGSRAQVGERLTAALLVPMQLTEAVANRDPETEETDGPLLGPFLAGVTSRAYVGVSVDTRGRNGPMSKPAAVPLVPAPPAPSSPTVTYDETSITLTWEPSADPSAADLLVSHPLGVGSRALAYHVYEVAAAIAVTDAPGAGGTPSGAPETRLTSTPVADMKYTDSRITWGVTRCYAVRAVETIGGLSVESDERQAICATLADTFPPAAPKGLSGVASEGAISLIWEPNSEKDLAGYLVLRGAAPGDPLEPITPAPIQATIFNDKVAAGVRYVYAIAAVDTAGNRSGMSNGFEEAAR